PAAARTAGCRPLPRPAAAAAPAPGARGCAATRPRTRPPPAARTGPAPVAPRRGSPGPPEALRQLAEQVLELAVARHAAGIGGLLPDPHRARERIALLGPGQPPRGTQALRFGGARDQAHAGARHHRLDAAAVQQRERAPWPALAPQPPRLRGQVGR